MLKKNDGLLNTFSRTENANSLMQFDFRLFACFMIAYAICQKGDYPNQFRFSTILNNGYLAVRITNNEQIWVIVEMRHHMDGCGITKQCLAVAPGVVSSSSSR